MLQQGISRVAAAAYAKLIIPESVKDVAINPKTKHDELCTGLILKQIRHAIKQDPKNLQKLINEVLKKLGGPVEHLIDALGKLLHNTIAMQPPFAC